MCTVAGAVAMGCGGEEGMAVAGCGGDLALACGCDGDCVHGSGAFLPRYRRMRSAAAMDLSPRRGLPQPIFVTVGKRLTERTLKPSSMYQVEVACIANV
jgi:hypothetical protein